MNEWWSAMAMTENWIALAAIPVLSAFVGWVTNALAIAMTFKPLEFVGIPRLRLGWQGIVPAKSAKMAGFVVDNALEKVADLNDLFQVMQPETIAEQLATSVDERLEDYIDEAMRESHEVMWERVPLIMRKRIYARTRRQLPMIMENLVEDVAANIEDLVDLRGMVVRVMRNNKALVVRVFTEVGRQELDFVVRSGLYFGFLFGLLQAIVFWLWPEPWLLPVFGFLTGYVTNWLALNVIFRPINPIVCGPLRLHGLFMQRKAEVSAQLSELMTQEVINLKQILLELLGGPHEHRTRAIVNRHLRPLLDSTMIRASLQVALGAEGFSSLKGQMADRALAVSLQSVEQASFGDERSQRIAKLLTNRLSQMSDEAFQNLLRPAFKEDEWILIVLGAVLGTLAGFVQWGLLWLS